MKPIRGATRLGVIMPRKIDRSDVPENMNGPTVVEWPNFFLTQKSLFVMYFAGHTGKFIRIAWSRSPEGPFHRIRFWPLAAIWPPFGFERRGHVASPEIISLDGKDYLLTHSPSRFRHRGHQVTYISRLYFGFILFRTKATALPSYARIFEWDRRWYAITNQARIFTIDGMGLIGKPVSTDFGPTLEHTAPDEVLRVRHPHVVKYRNRLLMFFTRIGDTPERIFMSEITVHDGGLKMAFEGLVEILRPEEQYEGVVYPNAPSKSGKARYPANALRDPFVLSVNDEHFLYYAIQAEFGIACCKLDMEELLRKLP